MNAHTAPTPAQSTRNLAAVTPDASHAQKRPTPTDTGQDTMNITATREGRNLHLAFEGVEHPFVIPPLPGRAGVQITQTYLGGAGGIGNVEELSEAMMMAVDGAVRDTETDRWHPLPEAERANYIRLGEEFSQSEAEDILQAAFFWQSQLGYDGVRIFLEAGGGIPGAIRALSAFRARVSILEQRDTTAAARLAGAAIPTDRKQKKGKK